MRKQTLERRRSSIDVVYPTPCTAARRSIARSRSPSSSKRLSKESQLWSARRRGIRRSADVHLGIRDKELRSRTGQGSKDDWSEGKDWTLDRPMPSDLEHLLSFIAKTCVALAKVDQTRGAGLCFSVVIYLNPSPQPWASITSVILMPPCACLST